LAAVLCRRHPAAHVTGHRLDQVDSGTSNRRRIFVEYDAAGRDAGLPPSVFCRATHDLLTRVFLGSAGSIVSKTTFYNRVRPLLAIEAPRCHVASYDAETFNSIVMLDDLALEGAAFCSHRTAVTKTHAESLVDLLAALHGRFFESPDLALVEHLGTLTAFFRRVATLDLERSCGEGFVEAADAIPARLRGRAAEVWPATVRAFELHEQLPRTLQHGDVHLKNWYLTRDGRMGLGDWQAMTIGHWSRDVAYALSTALTVENRRAWERDLLHRYLERFEAAGGPRIAFDEGWLRYRQQMPSALAWWTITLTPNANFPDMQPRDLTVEFIRRIAHALDDLESIDAL
ncbi:MAG TPA: phosphotransferase, partial [Nevskiaceae bacterium]|nr:phosphotransferase [Nevskiaceae bacterium]